MKLMRHYLNHPLLASRDRLAFTMVEIAICLAIIGLALVAIIGVLPTAMQVQKDNREETIINQDATYLIEAIRDGVHGLNDLTNYVNAITNVATVFNAAGAVTTPATTFGYTQVTPFAIISGERIIGLLSTPKYEYLNNGAVRSNYVTAYLRAISGSAVEKATNTYAWSFAFSYRMTPEIIPYAFYDRDATNYNLLTLNKEQKLARSNFWQYAKNQQANLYEIRLLFRWPLQPNGSVGNGRQIFRTTVGSALTATNIAGKTNFFFAPRSYVRVP